MRIAGSASYRRKAASPSEHTDVIDRIETICLEFPGYG